MAEGKIVELRGSYGFIEPAQGGGKVFFHRSSLENARFGDLQLGMVVDYEAEEGPRGLMATVVRMHEYRFLNPYNFVRFLNKPRRDNYVLGDCSPPPHDRYVGLTGRITGKVEAVTPLFVSDSHAIKRGENDHKTYRFFQVDGQPAIPAIPASSLRGMVRAVFEAVTNSCLAVFQEDEPYPLEYRVSEAPKKMIPARVVKLGEDGAILELLDCTRKAPGDISKGPTVVRAGAIVNSYPPRVLVDREKKQTFDPCKSQLPENAHDGMRVAALVTREPVKHKSNHYRAYEAVRVVSVNQHMSLTEDTEDNHLAKVFGWLHLTGPNIENKHDERLFFRWDDKDPNPPQIHSIPEECLCRCGKEVIKEYNHHLQGYWERHARKVEELGNRRWPNTTEDLPHPSTFVAKGRRVKEGDLLYALLDEGNNVIRLRPVSMPRLRYKYPRQKFLPEHLRRCENYDRLCPACRVFGWVCQTEESETLPPDKITACAGRVRFSHAILVERKGELPETPLTILSTPKPSTTPFYLLNSEGRPEATVDYDTADAQLRGRKFYRHHGEMLSEREYRRTDDIRDNQNRTVKGALKPGAVFEFTIDFENLAPLELGALLYALELEEGMFHRLGYAKPLGFGSVKVTVEKVRIIDWKDRLSKVDLGAGWQELENWPEYKTKFTLEMKKLYGENYESIVLADLRALLEKPPKLPIHYPRSQRAPDSEGKNYEWFVGNKRRIEAQKRGKSALPAPCTLPLASKERGRRGLPLIDRKGRGGSCE